MNEKEITDKKGLGNGKLLREKSMMEMPIFGHDPKINISSGIG